MPVFVCLNLNEMSVGSDSYFHLHRLFTEDCLKLNTVAAFNSLHLIIVVVVVVVGGIDVDVVGVVVVVVVVVDFSSFFIRLTESHSFIFIRMYMHASHRHTHRFYSPLNQPMNRRTQGAAI